MTNSEKGKILKNLDMADKGLYEIASLVENQPLDFIEGLNEVEYLFYRKAISGLLYSIKRLDTADINYKEYLFRKENKL